MTIKLIANCCYKLRPTFYTAVKWESIRLVAILNHTSLYEPLFAGVAPISCLWRLSKNLVGPGADITLERPIVGRFWKMMAGKGLSSITRKRDHSWKQFINSIDKNSIVAIAPEGRMKRRDGLDKNSRPMSVRSGIADILKILNDGDILFIYSKGLHHIQCPGENRFPKFFKKIEFGIESINLLEYLDYIGQRQHKNHTEYHRTVVQDLEERIQKNC